MEVKRNDLFLAISLLARELSLHGEMWKREAEAMTPAQIKRLGGPPRVLYGLTYVQLRDLHARLAPLVQALAHNETTITVTD